jgi:hypothetical protein
MSNLAICGPTELEYLRLVLRYFPHRAYTPTSCQNSKDGVSTAHFRLTCAKTARIVCEDCWRVVDLSCDYDWEAGWRKLSN